MRAAGIQGGLCTFRVRTNSWESLHGKSTRCVDIDHPDPLVQNAYATDADVVLLYASSSDVRIYTVTHACSCLMLR